MSKKRNKIIKLRPPVCPECGAVFSCRERLTFASGDSLDIVTCSKCNGRFIDLRVQVVALEGSEETISA